MPKFFKKDRKIPLRVTCHLTSLSSSSYDEQLMDKDVRVEFHRGNNERFISDTVRFKINDNKYTINFDELPFVCNSSFFLTKKGDWKEKICEFRVMVQDETSKSKYKPVAAQKYDMSKLLNNQKELKGDLLTVSLPLNQAMLIEFQMSISVSAETYARKLSGVYPNTLGSSAGLDGTPSPSMLPEIPIDEQAWKE